MTVYSGMAGWKGAVMVTRAVCVVNVSARGSVQTMGTRPSEAIWLTVCGESVLVTWFFSMSVLVVHIYDDRLTHAVSGI
jgi:hypothetical protein